jgi:hypothetical protein
MAYSLQLKTGDGVTTNFSAVFPVIDIDDVNIKVDDIELVKDVNYEVLNFNSFGEVPTISFFVAPVLDAVITLQRFTKIISPQSIFSNTSELTEFDLNKVNLQLLFAAQEADDRINNYINRVGGNNVMDQDLDMNGYRVKNLGIALVDTDAIGKKQAEDLFYSVTGGVVENPFIGYGYEIGQTAYAAIDLSADLDFEWISRDFTQQILNSEYPLFTSLTNGVYDIGGGFSELPALSPNEIYHDYYTRLK